MSIFINKKQCSEFTLTNTIYNTTKSTSLMARDLLTSDEVKQLHYKTIIFPIIGYPIFRDTVMFISFLVMKKVRLKEKLIH